MRKNEMKNITDFLQRAEQMPLKLKCDKDSILWAEEHAQKPEANQLLDHLYLTDNDWRTLKHIAYLKLVNCLNGGKYVNYTPAYFFISGNYNAVPQHIQYYHTLGEIEAKKEKIELPPLWLSKSESVIVIFSCIYTTGKKEYLVIDTLRQHGITNPILLVTPLRMRYSKRVGGKQIIVRDQSYLRTKHLYGYLLHSPRCVQTPEKRKEGVFVYRYEPVLGIHTNEHIKNLLRKQHENYKRI